MMVQLQFVRQPYRIKVQRNDHGDIRKSNLAREQARGGTQRELRSCKTTWFIEKRPHAVIFLSILTIVGILSVVGNYITSLEDPNCKATKNE